MKLQRFLIAATAAASLFSVNAFAQEAVAAGPATVGSAPDGAITMAKDNTGFLVTALLASDYINSSIPCFNCVNGSTSYTVGLSEPLAELVHGTKVQFVLLGQDTTASGSCSYSIAASIGRNSIYSNTIETTCTGGTVVYAQWPVTLPNSTGTLNVTVTVTTTAGTYSQKASFTVN